MGKQSPQVKSVQKRIDQMLKDRTRAAIRERNKCFAAEHQEDSDEELLAYLREQAGQLDTKPYCCAIIGGDYLAKRFGSWNRALGAAGLTSLRTGGEPDVSKTRVYRDEFRHQAALWRSEKQALKAAGRAARQRGKQAGDKKISHIEGRDLAWGEKHKDDSDEKLLDYVRRCADALGRTPRCREVEGGRYISKRFGSWSVALHLAGLPIPEGMKQPNPVTLAAYYEAHGTLVPDRSDQ